MQCKNIQVENFRNIEAASVAFSPGVNLLLGDNAQGKTNLLEAISLMAIGKSFRGVRDADLIRFGQQKATVTLDYCDHIRDMRLTATLMAGRKRRME
jgi:DNA replication and repair protein RecF